MRQKLYSAPVGFLAFAVASAACVDAVPLEDYPDPIEVRDVDPQGALAPEVIGRVDRSVPGQWRMSWPGVRIIARFRGTTVDADFDEIGLPDGVNLDPFETILPSDSADEKKRKEALNAPDIFSQFDVIVDGKPSNVLKLRGVPNGPREAELTSLSTKARLADGLDPNAEHSIELVRRSESSVGITTFKGFTFSGGGNPGYLPSFRAHKHRLLFAGDSITAGYGNEGDGFLCKFTPETSNARLSWASAAGRYLNAQAMLVAWSGKGMAINFRNDGGLTLPGLFDATVALDVPIGTAACDPAAKPGDLRPCFDPKSYAPEAIVVNLGTNDSNESYCPDRSEKCEESVRLQHGRDPDSASTNVCATDFAKCVDAACGVDSATNVSCVAPVACVDKATQCLAARPPAEQGLYVDKYSAFVKKLRKDYGPSPLIVGVLGPMLSNFASGDGPLGLKTTMANYIRLAIATSGETNVDYLQLDTHFFIESSGCDYHPSAITDRVMAKRLEAHIRRRIPTW